MRAYELIPEADTTFNASMWSRLVLTPEWETIYHKVRVLYNRNKRISRNFTLSYTDAGLTSGEVIRVSNFINRIRRKYDQEITQKTQLYDMIIELQDYLIGPSNN